MISLEEFRSHLDHRSTVDKIKPEDLFSDEVKDQLIKEFIDVVPRCINSRPVKVMESDDSTSFGSMSAYCKLLGWSPKTSLYNEVGVLALTRRTGLSQSTINEQKENFFKICTDPVQMQHIYLLADFFIVSSQKGFDEALTYTSMSKEFSNSINANTKGMMLRNRTNSAGGLICGWPGISVDLAIGFSQGSHYTLRGKLMDSVSCTGLLSSSGYLSRFSLSQVYMGHVVNRSNINESVDPKAVPKLDLGIMLLQEYHTYRNYIATNRKVTSYWAERPAHPFIMALSYANSKKFIPPEINTTFIRTDGNYIMIAITNYLDHPTFEKLSSIFSDAYVNDQEKRLATQFRNTHSTPVQFVEHLVCPVTSLITDSKVSDFTANKELISTPNTNSFINTALRLTFDSMLMLNFLVNVFQGHSGRFKNPEDKIIKVSRGGPSFVPFTPDLKLRHMKLAMGLKLFYAKNFTDAVPVDLLLNMIIYWFYSYFCKHRALITLNLQQQDRSDEEHAEFVENFHNNLFAQKRPWLSDDEFLEFSAKDNPNPDQTSICDKLFSVLKIIVFTQNDFEISGLEIPYIVSQRKV